MGKGYLKFKRRLRMGAWIKSLIFGVACGLIAISAMALWDKLVGTDARWLLYGAVGGITALIFMGILVLILFPSERRIAKRLDTALGLDEKVQTMVAYRKENGDMIRLQREDTDRLLAAAPTRRARSKRLWMNFVTPVLACGLLVTAILVPVKAQEPEPLPEDPPFELSQWQEMALEQLIEKVRTSQLDVTPKGEVVTALRELLAQVRGAQTEGVMKTAVINTIIQVHDIVTGYNTHEKMGVALKRSEHETLKRLGTYVSDRDAAKVAGELTATRDTLGGETVKADVTALATAVDEALAQSGLDQSDTLYRTLSEFKEALNGVVDTADGLTSQELTSALDMAFRSADGGLQGALLQQQFNVDVRDDTIRTLMSIFGITAADLPSDILSESSKEQSSGSQGGDRPEDEDEVVNSGGLGSGEVLFGSNDVIYDPDSKAYVTYGTVLDGYYFKTSERLLDGNLPPELEDAIRAYYASLYNGSPDREP